MIHEAAVTTGADSQKQEALATAIRLALAAKHPTNYITSLYNDGVYAALTIVSPEGDYAQIELTDEDIINQHVAFTQVRRQRGI